MKEKTRRKLRSVLSVLAILGPGIITVNAGNDAGGIATYSSVGANYGYKMLWGLLIITLGLSVVQEMNARMAVVTGKGLSDLIREKFGVKWAFFAMTVLLIANFGLVMGDFAGVAMSLGLFHVSKFISVPIAAVLIWALVTKGSYSKVEKVFLAFTFVFFGYIISAFQAKPDWSNVFRSMVHPTFELNKGYILTLIGLIGTTITPYMQFYLQSTVVDKHLSLRDYKYEKLDVYFGAIWGNAIAFFIIVCTAATLYKSHITFTTADQAAKALAPIAGEYASALFGIGLLGAALLACAIIPLSTAYAICEAFGFESGVDNDFREAPFFFGIYTFMIAASAALVLIPGIPLIKLAVVTQQIAGILSPVILIFMIILVNDKRIMGKYVNTKAQNIVSIATVAFIVVLSAVLVVSPFFE
ncbi:natural resistance-associated macrophage protein [[Clostridium] cellulosi]|uniref:Natural resistance-associated macrophage protein n=1 Tax=[Clostridium] cellulosi TaxID=29343 RepID=A0A078KL16_9FIRM|nr:natural resistance-associated macrophage protein [[Clostridium] cellulosi]